jgi:hypothetical protein
MSSSELIVKIISFKNTMFDILWIINVDLQTFRCIAIWMNEVKSNEIYSRADQQDADDMPAACVLSLSSHSFQLLIRYFLII